MIVCGALTKELLDMGGTGSAVSTMTKSFFDSLCPQSALGKVKDLVVNTADGCTQPYHGYAEADFEILGVRDRIINVSCFVVSN